jgi:hypothetical protein
MEEAGEEFFNHLWTLIGIGQWADPPVCQRKSRESEGGRCDAPSGPSGARVLASELAETLSSDGPAPAAGRREPSDSLQTEPQREAHLPGPYQLTRTAPGVSPCGSRMRGIYRAATLAAWLPRQPLAAAAGGMSGAKNVRPPAAAGGTNFTRNDNLVAPPGKMTTKCVGASCNVWKYPMLTCGHIACTMPT